MTHGTRFGATTVEWQSSGNQAVYFEICFPSVGCGQGARLNLNNEKIEPGWRLDQKWTRRDETSRETASLWDLPQLSTNN